MEILFKVIAPAGSRRGFRGLELFLDVADNRYDTAFGDLGPRFYIQYTSTLSFESMNNPCRGLVFETDTHQQTSLILDVKERLRSELLHPTSYLTRMNSDHVKTIVE